MTEVDELASYVDDIEPDDSVSVAWMSKEERRAARDGHELGEGVPVTIEGPDGDRHAIQVDLRGIGSTAELRQGMLQGYRELLGIAVPAHTICVQARLVSGASQLLTDETPLTDRLLGAVSFYVWADVSPADLYGPDVEIDDFAPPPASEAFATPEPVLGVDTPSVAQLKNLLGADLTGR